MRFISFASKIGPVATVPAGPAPAPLLNSSKVVYNVAITSSQQHVTCVSGSVSLVPTVQFWIACSMQKASRKALYHLSHELRLCPPR